MRFNWKGLHVIWASTKRDDATFGLVDVDNCSWEDQCETRFSQKSAVLIIACPHFLLVREGLMKILVDCGHPRSMKISAEKGFEVLGRS